MVTLLKINKITFEQSKNLEKKFTLSQNLAKILTENCLFNRDLNRSCLVYMFSLRFSGSKF